MGCAYMFNEKRVDELKILFELFKRSEPTFQYIINIMEPYIVLEGKKIVENTEN